MEQKSARPRGRETSLKNNLTSLKKHLTSEEAARKKEGGGKGVGVYSPYARRRGNRSSAALRSVDSWVRQKEFNTIIRECRKANSICDSRWFQRPCDGDHTTHPSGKA